MELKDKRFIEVSFPIKEVSIESSRERNIRHGHISTLHIWWARRPLAASRATSYAALIPTPKNIDEWERIKRFIIKLSKWENSLNLQIIEKARKDILKANNGKPPRILDCFAGGGSIPLEAMRLGCETYALEYNPVAVLILKCTLEYPQKYKIFRYNIKNEKIINVNPKKSLVEDIRKWGNWVLEETKKEIEKFYPPDIDGYIPIGYIWSRTIPCQNPLCNTEIPLIRQFWLVNKKTKKISLYPYIKDKEIKFKIVGTDYERIPDDFNPSKGTIYKAIAVCPICNTPVDAKTIKKLFQEGKSKERLIAVILSKPGRKGKKYRIANYRDLLIYDNAKKYLEEKINKLKEKWNINPIPDEKIPYELANSSIRARHYGMDNFGKFFNSRQKLVILTYIEKIKLAYDIMISRGYEREYSKVIISYLALILGKLLDWNSNLSRWRPDQERNEDVFSQNVIPMVWDYAERNPFYGRLLTTENIIKILNNLSQIPEIIYDNLRILPKVIQGSATSLPFPDEYFDAIFIDPPYYDNISYAELSDYFYVWLKRVLGELYPDLFSTPLTPKTKEIIANKIRHKNSKQAKKYFESMLKKSFKEIYRVLKPGGIVTIVYTHKSTSGWETLINSLLDSGLVVTASWPIDTEMKGRKRAAKSAALISSIYFICRKIQKKGIGWLKDVKYEIREYLQNKLERLWEEGISGADFFIAAIGSSIEIFGKYEKVMDYEGNIVRADKLLEYVREIVTNYAIKQILHNGITSELSPLTRFYILWRWTYGEAKVHFDDARKLAQSTGIDLSREWNKGFIIKEKEFIRVLGPHERKIKDIQGSSELIDVLHYVLLLWKAGMKEEMKKVLEESGYGKKEAFYKVAQAISETLPMNSQEKKLLDGFLSGKDKLLTEMEHKIKQTRLFE